MACSERSIRRKIEEELARKVMKQINVACAIIEQNGKVLATQRSSTMSLPLKWEFPGGKIDPGESTEDCLRRELAEELGIRVCLGRNLPHSTYHYPTFAITLYPFVCSIESGNIVLYEHSAMAWLLPDQLYTLDWAEADLPVIDLYLAESASHR